MDKNAVVFNNPQALLQEEMNLLGQNKPVVNKWAKHIEAVERAWGGKMPLDRRVVLATALENTQQKLADAGSLYETAVQPSDVGPFKKFAIELLTALVPSMIVPDIVTVQPMTNRIGEVRYIEYMYASDKGRTKAGTPFGSPFNKPESDIWYSSEYVEEEFIAEAGKTEYSGNLDWLPIRPGTVEIMVDGYKVVDNGNGKLQGEPLAGDGEINYGSGQFDFELSAEADEDIFANYEYNNEDVPAQSPKVKFRLKTSPVSARTRKINTSFSFDAAIDMQRDYGGEINAMLVSQMAAEIKHEIDGEIMADLRKIASATEQPIVFDAAVPQAINMRDHYDTFLQTVIRAGNAIFNKTRRASLNFLIGGTNVANIVEYNRQFVRADGTGFGADPVGPHLSGFLNGIPFYKNPFYDPNHWVGGYKGRGLFDAGYAYLPHYPVMASQLIMTEEFEAKRGYATSYGKKNLNSDLYVKGEIKNFDGS